MSSGIFCGTSFEVTLGKYRIYYKFSIINTIPINVEILSAEDGNLNPFSVQFWRIVIAKSLFAFILLLGQEVTSFRQDSYEVIFGQVHS
jgi:hypothetical protein